MSSPLAKGSDIERLLQQRWPILMVDELTSATDTEARTALTVGADNMFCSCGKLTEAGLIEHIAQSASAFVCYRHNKLAASGEPLLGYIGEVKKLAIVGELPPISCRVETTIRIMQEVMNITLFAAETSTSNGVVATCQMKLSV